MFLKYFLKLSSVLLMVSSIDFLSSTANVPTVAQRLVRTIMFSKGEFSLLLVCCNSTAKQKKEVLSLIQEFSLVEVVELALPYNAKTLYDSISSGLDAISPQGLIVTGLESVIDINPLIVSANLMRDQFAKRYNFPIILWINDEILRKLIRLAPDFKSWATTLRFDSAQEPSLKCQPLSA